MLLGGMQVGMGVPCSGPRPQASAGIFFLDRRAFAAMPLMPRTLLRQPLHALCMGMCLCVQLYRRVVLQVASVPSCSMV